MSEKRDRTAGEEQDTGPGSPPQGTGQELDEVAALSLELEEARAKEAEYLDGWQRARAELANARKRFQREQQQAYANAQADVLTRVLPIVDDLDRALETLPESLSGSTWIEGVTLIQRNLSMLLEQAGVSPIDAEGKEFDPFSHEAATHEPSESVPEGHIISELHRGYRLGDRVLRPSRVRVSAGTLQPDEAAASSDQKDQPETTPSDSDQAPAS